MDKKYYITTTLPYVNAEPHIGFALEIIQADVVARFHKEILKEEVVFKIDYQKLPLSRSYTYYYSPNGGEPLGW